MANQKKWKEKESDHISFSFAHKYFSIFHKGCFVSRSTRFIYNYLINIRWHIKYWIGSDAYLFDLFFLSIYSRCFYYYLCHSHRGWNADIPIFILKNIGPHICMANLSRCIILEENQVRLTWIKCIPTL